MAKWSGHLVSGGAMIIRENITKASVMIKLYRSDVFPKVNVPFTADKFHDLFHLPAFKSHGNLRLLGPDSPKAEQFY